MQISKLLFTWLITRETRNLAEYHARFQRHGVIASHLKQAVPAAQDLIQRFLKMG